VSADDGDADADADADDGEPPTLDPVGDPAGDGDRRGPDRSVPGPTVRAVEGEWPVDLHGVTESVVTTPGPNDLWNVAALGLHAPDAPGRAGDDADDADDDVPPDAVTATTWGRTRTWRNFHERGEGVVQFTTDPGDFVDAALAVREESTPVLASADAWVQVRPRRVDAGESGGTRWEEWVLEPVVGAVRRERVPTTNRGRYAVVDATVAASRLDVPAYDADELLARLAYFEDVVGSAGSPAERAAFERVDELAGWRDRA
jgi:hypothetical protein